MRLRLALVPLVAGLGFAGSPSVASTVEHGSDRGQFALAGWSSIDPQTGAEHFRMIETSGPLEGPALVAYSGSDSTSLTCPGGLPGYRSVEASGQGPGTLVVARRLSAATLRASFAVETVTTTYCGDTVTSAVRHQVQALSFGLTASGNRWTETSGSAIKLPGLQNSHQRSRAVGRDAAGAFQVGGTSYPVVFGDFGRITGIWHFSAQAGRLAERLRTLPAAVALAAATENGSLQRAGALWERSGSDSYHGLFVGADRARSGETVVSMQSYAFALATCGDGSQAPREVFRTGEGPGTLVVRGNHAVAHVAGRLRIETTVSDGCSGSTTTAVARRVPAGADLTADGSAGSSGEWITVHTPPGGPQSMFVDWNGRSAAGSLWTGSQRRSSTWGEIGTLRWRQRLSASASP